MGGHIEEADRLEKPEALVRYEKRMALGLPYQAGGYLDQPYLWLQEDGAIVTFLAEWKAANSLEPSEGKSSWQSPPNSLQALSTLDI